MICKSWPALAATTNGGTPWLTEIWTSPDAIAALIAVPVSKLTQFTFTPISFSYVPICFAYSNGIGHSRKYATVISSIAEAAPADIISAAAAVVDRIFFVIFIYTLPWFALCSGPVPVTARLLRLGFSLPNPTPYRDSDQCFFVKKFYLRNILPKT